MQYYRCKCGKREAWGSTSPYPCSGCEECGTTLDQHPDDHKKPKPHDWQTTYVDTDSGKQGLTRCGWCGIRKSANDIAADRMRADTKANWDHQSGPHPDDI